MARTQPYCIYGTHDLSEGFYLGTRLWVFDKLRRDPHAPDAYGASITYDLPITRNKIIPAELKITQLQEA